jgi:hypothetical protein
MATRIKSNQITDNVITAADLHSAIAINTTASGTFGSVVVDTITIDQAAISTTANMTLDSGSDIILDADGGNIMLKDGTVWFGNFNHNGNNLAIDAKIVDGDIKFRGTKSGSPNVAIDALILDMSADGDASFNSNVKMNTGYSVGKFAVKNTSVHNSYDFYNNGSTYLNGSTIVDDVLQVSDTTSSTSSTTGSLQVLGGAGIAENLNVGGNIVVNGNLTVEGTQTTLNTTALDVEDKNITLNYHASNDTSSTANGAGITIQDAVDASNDASILWDASGDKFNFSHAVRVQGADIANRTTTTATPVLSLFRDVTDSSHTSTKDSAVDFLLSRQQAVNNNYPYTRLDIRLSGGTDSSTPSLDVMSLLHNGNVGIDEDTPLAKLHVVGGRTSGTTYNTIIAAGGVNSTDGSGARIVLTGCENDPLARGTVIEGISTGTGNSHILNFKTNNGSNVPITRMTIGHTGNVGIGTGSGLAQARLDAVGTIRHTSDIVSNGVYNAFSIGSNRTVNDYGGLNKEYWAIQLKTPGTNTDGQASAHAYGSLVFSGVSGADTTLDDVMTLKYNGNVGIGTLMPLDKLYVQDGDIGINNSGTGGRRYRLISEAGGGFTLRDQTAAAGRLNIDNSGNFTLTRGSNVQTDGLTIINTQAGGYGSALVWKSKRSDAPQAVKDAAKIVVSGANSWGSDGNTSSNLSFWTQKDNTLTEHMFLSKNGNLGVGTNNPSHSRLQIHENASVTYDDTAYQHDIFLEKRNTGGDNEFTGLRFAVTGHNGSTTAEASIGIVQLDNHHAGELVFGTRNAAGDRKERMRLTNNGGLELGYAGATRQQADSQAFTIVTPATGGGQGIALKRLDSNNDQSLGSVSWSNNTQDGLSYIMSKTDGAVNTTDIKLQVSNAGTLISALVLDGSEGGKAWFSGQIRTDRTGTSTNSVDPLLYLNAKSSNTTLAGFGPGIVFSGDRNGDGATQQMARINAVAETNSGTDLSSGLQFMTATQGVNSNKMTISHQGNVLIGNTSNTYTRALVTIHSTAGAPATTGTSTANVGLRIGTTSGNSQVLDFGVYNTAPYGSWIQGANAGGLQGSAPLQINPNGGQVSIGQKSPDADLHVNKVNATTTNTGYDGATLLLTGKGWDTNLGGYNHGWRISTPTVGYSSGTGSSNSSMVFHQLAADGGSGSASPSYIERLRINQEGRVGIATSTPAGVVEIRGENESQDATDSDDATGAERPITMIRGANGGSVQEWVHSTKAVAPGVGTQTAMISWYRFDLPGGWSGQGTPGMLEVTNQISGMHSAGNGIDRFIVVPSNGHGSIQLYGGLQGTTIYRTFAARNNAGAYTTSLSTVFYYGNHTSHGYDNGSIFMKVTHASREPIFTMYAKYIGGTGSNRNYYQKLHFLGTEVTNNHAPSTIHSSPISVTDSAGGTI